MKDPMKKEGSMNFGARDVSLYHLTMTECSYDPKNINTMALRATSENIGKLSLEFSADMIYDESGVPQFTFRAVRFTDGKPERYTHLALRVGDWIVMLWDEIHVFRDPEFRSTFSCKSMELQVEQGLIKFEDWKPRCDTAEYATAARVRPYTEDAQAGVISNEEAQDIARDLWKPKDPYETATPHEPTIDMKPSPYPRDASEKPETGGSSGFLSEHH